MGRPRSRLSNHKNRSASPGSSIRTKWPSLPVSLSQKSSKTTPTSSLIPLGQKPKENSSKTPRNTSLLENEGSTQSSVSQKPNTLEEVPPPTPKKTLPILKDTTPTRKVKRQKKKPNKRFLQWNPNGNSSQFKEKKRQWRRLCQKILPKPTYATWHP